MRRNSTCELNFTSNTRIAWYDPFIKVDYLIIYDNLTKGTENDWLCQFNFNGTVVHYKKETDIEIGYDSPIHPESCMVAFQLTNMDY